MKCLQISFNMPNQKASNDRLDKQGFLVWIGYRRNATEGALVLLQYNASHEYFNTNVIGVYRKKSNKSEMCFLDVY